MKTLDEVLTFFENHPATKLFPEHDKNARIERIEAFYSFVHGAFSKHLSIDAYAASAGLTPEIRFLGKIGPYKFRCYGSYSTRDIIHTAVSTIREEYEKRHIINKHIINKHLYDASKFIEIALESDIQDLVTQARNNIHGVQRANEIISKKKSRLTNLKRNSAISKVQEALKQHPLTLEELTDLWKSHQVHMVMDS